MQPQPKILTVEIQLTNCPKMPLTSDRSIFSQVHKTMADHKLCDTTMRLIWEVWLQGDDLVTWQTLPVTATRFTWSGNWNTDITAKVRNCAKKSLYLQCLQPQVLVTILNRLNSLLYFSWIICPMKADGGHFAGTHLAAKEAGVCYLQLM